MLKKIFSVSYYADFARYFDALNKNMGDEKIKWVDISLHLSSYVYNKTHKIDSIYLPRDVRKYNIEDSKIDKNIMIDFCRHYGVDKSKFNICNIYYNYIYDLLVKEMPDLIILSGDERLPIKIFKNIANKLSINILHFEQGPCGTTILDPIGVNANCSFRKIDGLDKNALKKDKLLLNKKEKWKYSKFYRVIDVIYENMPFFHYDELMTYKLKIKNNIISETNNVSEIEKKRFILLVLQVPEDVNMLCHSPFFSNHFDIVESVYQSIPSNYKLIVREHPLYKNKYETQLYDFIKNNQNIELDSTSNLKDAICESSLVIVNNSTVGIEAMLYGQTIVVLGNSYYDLYTYKFSGDNLGKLIIEALNKPIDKDLISQRLNFLFNNYFLSGHFKDKDLTNLTEHVDRINELLL
ncbi:capsular polysaccharide export protein, LipB/KpsS family [Photobacterium damselae]|uniref:capsular polysaccharide export protein, LipB/KpsS family n=1 Tax=Photobacterium damselae TaxID=38293 RepID=UPI0040684CFB